MKITKTRDDLRAGFLDRTRRTLETLAASDRPIIVGPWIGEIGFEVLYWIPFLRWALKAVPIPADRLTVVSRGGCASWYTGMAAHYWDLYEHYTPAAVLELNAQRVIEQRALAMENGRPYGFGSRLKQYCVTPSERALLAQVSRDALVLHPGLMFSLFRLFWRRRVFDLYHRCTRTKRMIAPPRIEGLPERYTAVKFYTSPVVPDDPEWRNCVQQIVSQVADTMPVVVLDSGSQYDDHGSFPIEDTRVISMPLEPATNLAVQTAVIAHAAAYVGTYGGVSYLPLYFGVPTTAFYAGLKFRRDHYELAMHVAGRLRTRYKVGPLDQWPRVRYAA